MIASSNDFTAAINQTSRQFKARLMVDGAALDCDISKITCYKGSCGQELALGCVYAPYMEVSLMRCSENIEGKKISYQVGVNTGTDFEYIDIGKFTVMDPVSGNGSAAFTCFGTIGLLGNKPYASSLTYPATIQAVTNELSSMIFAEEGANIYYSGIPQTILSNTIENAITGNIREVLSIIASLVGGFVSEDNAGNVVIAGYNSGAVFDIQPYRSLSLPEIRDTPFQVLGLHVTVKETSQDETGADVPEEYFEYGTPVIFQTIPWMTQAIFDQMAAHFCELSFDLAVVDISLGDPRIEPWDVIALTDLKDEVYGVPCFTIRHVFDGGFRTVIEAEISSTDVSNARVKGALEKHVERLDSDIFASKQAAEQAKHSADLAAEAAETAVADASAAQAAAANAQLAAANAQADAGAAKESADTASRSAASALVQLGTIEDVVGTLNWISQHGEFAATEDRQVDSNKRYYEQTFDYLKTSDSTVAAGKDYYARSGSGSDEDPYVFTLVANPTVSDLDDYYELSSIGYDYYPIVEGNPQELGLYELVSIDAAVTNYISKHLALTESGLWLTGDDSDYKILLDDHGFYIYGPDGLVSSFGEDIVFSSDSNQRIGNDVTFVEFDHVDQKLKIVTDELHIGSVNAGDAISAQQQQLNELTGYVDINTNEGYIRVGKTDADSYVQIDGDNAQVAIIINGKVVAYMSGDRFYAPSAVVTNLYMKTELSGSAIGDIGWVMRSNGHLSLKRIR